MKQYRQFTTNEYSKNYQWLIKKPIRLAVFSLCAIRARREEFKADNLAVGEFYLAETEYYKFDLKKSQRGQIRRVIRELIQADLVEKVENKTGNKGASIYCLKDNDVFDINIPDREQDGEQTENKERTNGEQTEINNNDNNVKKNKSIAEPSSAPEGTSKKELSREGRRLNEEAVELIKYWQDKCEEGLGKKGTVTAWGRYIKQARPFLKELGLTRMKALCDGYFVIFDEPFIKNGRWGLNTFLMDSTIHKLNNKY